MAPASRRDRLRGRRGARSANREPIPEARAAPRERTTSTGAPTSSGWAAPPLPRIPESLADSSPLQSTRDQSIDRLRRVVELLIRREAIPRFHLGDQPAVVPDLRERRANRRPVVVAEEQIRVDALVTAAAAMLQHVLEMHARNAWAVDFDPLLGKPRVVDVADVEMNADGGTVHVVQEFRELARAHEKALLGVAVLAADLHAGALRGGRECLQRVHAATRRREDRLREL